MYLNLGSGPRGIADDHWINIDGFKDTNVGHVIDFARKWLIPDSVFDGIFCEHVFEHFDLEQGAQLLGESIRVLRPRGKIRIIVPDGAKILRMYCENPSELLAHREAKMYSAMQAVNSYFRQRYEHQFIYDYPTLRQQLEQVGFVNVVQVSFGQAEGSRALVLDDETYAWESLYVEAEKPA